MDRSKKLIEEMIEVIFQNRREQEYNTLHQRLSEHLKECSRTNMIHSGSFISGVSRFHGETLHRVLDSCLDELRQQFREAGRQDGTFFWNVVNEKLKSLADSIKNSLSRGAIDYCKMRGGLAESDERIVYSAFNQYGDTSNNFIGSRVSELRVRSQFISMKSPLDRKANNIPDVAVMMWFPSEGENKQKAEEKFQAIKDAVSQASNGLATVDKINNPTLVHKDRISPSVEQWLEKAVLVICDLEGNRPNVFYEFGYTRAIGTDVIATIPHGQTADFHITQWPTDDYKNFDELKTKLAPKIATVLSKHDLSGSL